MIQMEIIKKLNNISNIDCILTEEKEVNFYATDWLRLSIPKAIAVVFPKNTQAVCEIVKACRKEKVKIVPSGGRTGLSGGADAANGEIILSLEKMNKVLSISLEDQTINVQAGVITEKIQNIAAENNLFYPVDFASKGSSQIGGNIATNAGGIKVIKYGLTRDWILGLTVVTGNGEVLELNGNLFKNQAGPDLKNLFIGSEGIFGIITEAWIKLTSIPSKPTCILAATNKLDNLPKILRILKAKFKNLSMFEFFKNDALQVVCKEHSLSNPFSDSYKNYLLIEVEEENSSFSSYIEEVFFKLLEDELLTDVLIADGIAKNKEFIAYRELISETLTSINFVYKNDISVPVPSLPDFIIELEDLSKSIYKGAKNFLYGHIGDGNIHINVLMPDNMEKDVFLELCHSNEDKIFNLVKKYSGSISAEHGIGLLKKDSIGFTRSNAELNSIKSIKTVFDPDNIINPGKVI